MTDLNPYENVDGVDFASIAKGFDFRSPRLGVVDFPDRFVQDYVAECRDAPDRLETGIGHSVAEFADGPVACDPAMVLAPKFIFSINRILDESLYAAPGSVILPPGFYVIAECYEDRGQVYLLVNLVRDSGDYGKVFYWRKAHDPIGTGDNTNPPAPAADTLGAYFAGLMTEQDARAKAAGLR